MTKSPRCHCPVMTELFELIGKKWVLFILHAVSGGKHTFTTIREAVGGANTKILTDRLNELITSGILEKDPERGYILTAHGSRLMERIHGVAKWWEEEKAEK